MPMPADAPLGLLLLSGTHERAHYAFVLATGAAALGRKTVLFATNAGCHALLADWSGLADSARDARLREAGVAGLDTLREAAADLAVTLIACEAGLRAEGLQTEPLAPGVQIAGVATFLSETSGGQLISL
jgi:peroxiredoxin family protein